MQIFIAIILKRLKRIRKMKLLRDNFNTQAARDMANMSLEEAERIQDLIVDAMKGAIENKRAVEGKAKDLAKDENRELKYSLRLIPADIDEQIENNRKTLMDMNTVSTLKNTIFTKDGRKFSEKALEFFNSLGNTVFNEVVGDVELSERTVSSDIAPAHGKLTRTKVITFAAIPDVIRNGKLIDYKIDHKGRGYDSVSIAAPVKIVSGEEGNESHVGRYLVGVVINRDEKEDWQKFYVHKYAAIKIEDALPESAGADSDTARSASPLVNLLHEIIDSKEIPKNSSEENSDPNENSAGMTRLHGKRRIEIKTDKGVCQMPVYEEKDQEYASALNSGDMEKAEALVENAAEQAGYIKAAR